MESRLLTHGWTPERIDDPTSVLCIGAADTEKKEL